VIDDLRHLPASEDEWAPSYAAAIFIIILFIVACLETA
jgi:hypothetical protein